MLLMRVMVFRQPGHQMEREVVVVLVLVSVSIRCDADPQARDKGRASARKCNTATSVHPPHSLPLLCRDRLVYLVLLLAIA